MLLDLISLVPLAVALTAAAFGLAGILTGAAHQLTLVGTVRRPVGTVCIYRDQRTGRLYASRRALAAL